ncbi:hypothetical protein VTN96DRAFT_5014 [Rasamsonia emersonii]
MTGNRTVLQYDDERCRVVDHGHGLYIYTATRQPLANVTKRTEHFIPVSGQSGGNVAGEGTKGVPHPRKVGFPRGCLHLAPKDGLALGRRLASASQRNRRHNVDRKTFLTN